MQFIECLIRNVSFVAEKVNFFVYPVLNRSIFHTVLFRSFSTVRNMPLFKTGRLEQCRFVELDCLVEDVYCYSEFHAPCGAIIRQLPKITDAKDDVQNLKIQNNAYWRDVQKCDRLS